MENQNNLKYKRIHAYTFIKHLFKSVNWVDADLTKDNDLASLLDVKLSDLTLLKEGKVNPSPKLVENVKGFFKKNGPNSILATQIDRTLVDPFKNK